MTMTRWDPMEMEWPDRLRRWLDIEPSGDRMMRVEEIHNDTEIVVRAEMPGIDPDKDVDLWVDESILHIVARREAMSEHVGKKGYCSEFHYGEFSRTLPLPQGVDINAVTATYSDGVLEVHVPCTCEPISASKKIQVLRS